MRILILLLVLSLSTWCNEITVSRFRFSGSPDMPALNTCIVFDSVPIQYNKVPIEVQANELYYRWKVQPDYLIIPGTKGRGLSQVGAFHYPTGMNVQKALRTRFYKEQKLNPEQDEPQVFFGKDNIYCDRTILWYRESNGAWTQLEKVSSESYLLLFDGTPQNFSWLVNGAPSVSEVKAGTHTIQILAPGYLPLDTTVTVSKNTTIHYTLSEALTDVTLLAKNEKNDSYVAGVDIVVNGEIIGKTPVECKLKPGRHTLTARKKGFQSKDVALQVGVQKVTQTVLLAADVAMVPYPSVSGALYGMKKIPGGTFKMGQPDPNIGDSGDTKDEQPVHSVTVDGFWMDSTEVTQAEYKRLMGVNPSNFSGSTKPVEQCNWYDAVLYCNARSKEAGLDTVYSYSSVTGSRGDDCELSNVRINYSAKGYRLPTEAEWEYACKAGTSTKYYWGNSNSKSVMKQYAVMKQYTAVYDTTPYYIAEGLRSYGTHSVASYKPNRFGLYDMSGNVWEWCNDWYRENYYASSSSSNPQGPNSGSYRVARGGSWDGEPAYLRSANRYGFTPGNQGYFLGFRVLLPL